MRRIVVIVVLLYLVWRILYARSRRQNRARTAREEAYLKRLWAGGVGRAGDAERPAPSDDRLVACERCGVSVPSRTLRPDAEGRGACEACRRGEEGR